MNRLIVSALAAAAVIAANAADAPQFKDDREKASYSVGVRYGSTWKQQGFDIDPELFAKGLKDAYAGSPALKDEEIAAAMSAYQQTVRAKMDEKRKVEGAANLEKANKFLAENKTKEGVKELEGGLQYKVIKEGAGATPGENDNVTTHYTGKLIDGTEFDSSHKRGQPATFNINGVIKGWTEALKKMKVGSKWELYIPPQMAYGERGFGQNIPPNSALIFEIELLDTKPQAAQTTEPVTSDIIKVPSAEELKKGAKIEVIKPDQLKKEQEAAKPQSK
ncbi:MAG TPA: FKBP-type peptidyl-prolyl cis-trans isomerase [Methylomirabilota bacterium]|nr:FKBP-type peptidyl-prolyl cis-trans isomerase [Methylomirabilota bacterium]